MITVAYDVETHPIKPGCPLPRMVCGQFADGKASSILLRDEALDMFEWLLTDPQYRLVGHNIFYDLGVSVAERPSLMPEIFKAFDEGRLGCTMIRQMIIDNASGDLKFLYDEVLEEWKKQDYSLARLALRHSGKRLNKGEDTWRLRYRELDNIPVEEWPEDARAYALSDPVETLAVHRSQEHLCAPEGIPGEAGQMQAAWGLYLMQCWGVRTDPVAVAALREEFTIEYEKHVDVAQQHGYVRENKTRDLKAIKVAVEAWYKGQDKDVPLSDSGKNTSTSRETLTGTDDEGLRAVADLVATQKLLSTYIALLEHGTHTPINCRYNPIIETFRTSCSKPNWQNLPRKGDVRACVIPRDGSTFDFCDYDTLEMRTLAQVCLDLFGYSHIADAARAGEDFHLSMAADMLSMTYEEAVTANAAGDAEVEEARQISKPLNYGAAGGMGPAAFVDYARGYGVEVSIEKATELFQSYRRKWREMNDYFNYCSSLCGPDGNAKHVEFVRSGLVRGHVKYTAVANGHFQHLAAMGAKQAVYEVARECYVDMSTHLFGCRPWLFAHDEIGMENPYRGRRGSDASFRLQEVMENEMRRWCPDVPISASVVKCRRWLKGAKPVIVDGVLVPSKKKGKEWVADL